MGKTKLKDYNFNNSIVALKNSIYIKTENVSTRVFNDSIKPVRKYRWSILAYSYSVIN